MIPAVNAVIAMIVAVPLECSNNARKIPPIKKINHGIATYFVISRDVARIETLSFKNAIPNNNNPNDKISCPISLTFLFFKNCKIPPHPISGNAKEEMLYQNHNFAIITAKKVPPTLAPIITQIAHHRLSIPAPANDSTIRDTIVPDCNIPDNTVPANIAFKRVFTVLARNFLR